MIVNIISYGRAKDVVTAQWLHKANIVVPNSQKAEYELYNPNNPIIGIPDELDGNTSRKRNATLDLFKGEDVTIVDDDMKAVGYFEDGRNNIVREDYFLEFCENMYQMCKEVGTILWGVNVQSDRKFYREYSPFSLSSVVLGPWSNIVNTDNLRYREEIYLKEDYDFSLQVLNKYRKILRNNKWFYVSEHIKNSGGLASKRNFDREREHALRFQKIWGSKIVDLKRKTQGGNVTINPIVRIPIKGI